MTDSSEVQSLKASLSMMLTLSGRVIEVRFEQFLNVSSKIKLKFEGRSTMLSSEQPLKALWPILFTRSGMVIDNRLVKLAKALLPILTTSGNISTSLTFPATRSHPLSLGQE